jgi:hypothetical protein
MSLTTEWKKCFSNTHKLHYWYNSTTKKYSWNEPYFSKKHKQYYYIEPKTNKSIWFESKKETSVDIEQKSSDTTLLMNQEKTVDTYTQRKKNPLILRAIKKRLEAQKKEMNKKKVSSLQDLEKDLGKMKIEKDLSSIVVQQKDIESTKVEKKETNKKKVYTQHKNTTTTHAVSNGLGHYHEYEAPSHWDKYDHMEHLRDLRDSMNPYD